MKKLTVKLDEATIEWLRQQGVREHRSVSGQVRYFLDVMRRTNPDGTVIPPEALEGAAIKFEAALSEFVEERRQLMAEPAKTPPAADGEGVQ